MPSLTRPFTKTRDDQAVKETLARETDSPLEEVERVYEEELSQLEGEARITQYLGVLASRRTRIKLRKQH